MDNDLDIVKIIDMITCKILVVGGTWDDKQGMPSSTIKNIKKILKEDPLNKVYVYNGGNINDIDNTLVDANTYDYIFWFANIEKDIKSIAPNCKLITYKRNDKKKLSFEDLVDKMNKQQAYLSFEFVKQQIKIKRKHYHKFFNITLFDNNGNILYEGEHIKEAIPIIFIH